MSINLESNNKLVPLNSEVPLRTTHKNFHMTSLSRPIRFVGSWLAYVIIPCVIHFVAYFHGWMCILSWLDVPLVFSDGNIALGRYVRLGAYLTGPATVTNTWNLNHFRSNRVYKTSSIRFTHGLEWQEKNSPITPCYCTRILLKIPRA